MERVAPGGVQGRDASRRFAGWSGVSPDPGRAGLSRLYASPVNFDPDASLFPISHPADYARELAEAVGTYHTTGMVEDHTGINNERLGEEAFLDQCDLAWREREAMMLHELERADEGLFFCLFDTPDRVQHLFWRLTANPITRRTAREARLRPEFAARVIEDHYRRCDEGRRQGA